MTDNLKPGLYRVKPGHQMDGAVVELKDINLSGLANCRLLRTYKEMNAGEMHTFEQKDLEPVPDSGTHTRTANYVCGFAFNTFNCVALIAKSKPEWQKGRLNGVGGKIEGNESPQEAMVREFDEETGIYTDHNKWTEFCTMKGPIWCVHFMVYNTVIDAYNTHILPNKEEPVHWYDTRLLPSNVLYNLRWLIPLCQDKTVCFPVEVRDGY